MKNIEEYKNIQTYFWQKISIKDKALFYEHLSNLVDGGVSVINSLEAFLEKTDNPAFAKEVANLLFFINSGDSFSVAMKKLPYIFIKKEVAIIEAGESSGTMQRSFENLAKQLREQNELKAKVKSALTYPTIIMIFLFLAVMVIMTYVIPKLTPLFETAGVELPFATQLLVNTSDFVTNNFYLIIFFIAALIFGIRTYSLSDSGKAVFDNFYLKIPLLGNVYKNYIIAQVSSNLGLLIGAGIPIIKTLRLSGESSDNAIYQKAIELIANKVSEGKKLTSSIEEVDPEHRYFPNDFIQMISAGEKTSTINTVCMKINTQYTREVENSLNVLIKWIEPAAILIAGIFVLWFAFAIFGAVLKITDTVG